MNQTIPDSLVRYEQALDAAIRRELARAAARRRRQRLGIRFAAAAVATAAVGLGAVNLLVRGAPTAASPAAASVIRQAAAALTQPAGTILQIRVTGTQNNGNGTTVTWSEESFSEQRPPYDTRLVDERLPGTPPGVEQGTVSGVPQVYDPIRNTIYIGPSPTNANLRHYLFSPGPRPGTYRVRVPTAYRVSGRIGASDWHAVYHTAIVTALQARALRNGSKIVVFKRLGHGDRIAEMRVVRAPRVSPANNTAGLDPFSATFRSEILALLRSGHARVTGHATAGGQDTIRIQSANSHTTYYVNPDTYKPVELTTTGTTGGTVLRFDVYQELAVNEDRGLLSLTAQHATATVDRSVAGYRAAEARLFPHG